MEHRGLKAVHCLIADELLPIIYSTRDYVQTRDLSAWKKTLRWKTHESPEGEQIELLPCVPSEGPDWFEGWQASIAAAGLAPGPMEVLIGVRMKDGERLWETFEPTTGKRRAGHGTAFLVKHENGYFLFSETGDLILARLTPEGYEEISRFHVLEPTNEAFGRDVVWTHPAFADRAAFVRNDSELVCVDLAAE